MKETALYTKEDALYAEIGKTLPKLDVLLRGALPENMRPLLEDYFLLSLLHCDHAHGPFMEAGKKAARRALNRVAKQLKEEGKEA